MLHVHAWSIFLFSQLQGNIYEKVSATSNMIQCNTLTKKFRGKFKYLKIFKDFQCWNLFFWYLKNYLIYELRLWGWGTEEVEEKLALFTSIILNKIFLVNLKRCRLKGWLKHGLEKTIHIYFRQLRGHPLATKSQISTFNMRTGFLGIHLCLSQRTDEDMASPYLPEWLQN